jgi:hypothetical protein
MDGECVVGTGHMIGDRRGYKSVTLQSITGSDMSHRGDEELFWSGLRC